MHTNERHPSPLANGSSSDAAPSRGAQGIDIRQALEILSSRSAHSHDDHHDQNNDIDGSCHEHVPDEAKAMGQTIDLMTSAGGREEELNEDASGAAAPGHEQDMEEKKKARRKREVAIKEKLQSMNVTDLLGAVMEAQSERVATYREYDGGLETVLQTGNMSNYPSICAKATASFSVLSDTINAIEGVLVEGHNRRDLQKLLRQLQQHEKEKLNVTAALHLERIRERNQKLQVNNYNNNNGGDERVSRLLQEGVTAMKERIATCVEGINEVLEELRYALAEEEQ